MNKKRIFMSSIICVFILITFIVLYKTNESSEEIILSNDEETIVKEENVEEDEKKTFYIDVKGAVKKQGVYEVSEGMIVNDAIKLAGGIKSTGTTENINLSQDLSKGMVIYVYTKSELTTTSIITTTNQVNTTSIINFISPNTTEVTDSKININLDSKEKLVTLTGIGEAKADAIIEYRNTKKFEKIEDIMNISGIGESAFEKIKDNIKV